MSRSRRFTRPIRLTRRSSVRKNKVRINFDYQHEDNQNMENNIIDNLVVEDNPLANRKKRWTHDDIIILLNNFKNKIPMNETATQLKRTEIAVTIKLENYFVDNRNNIDKLINESGLTKEEVNHYVKHYEDKKNMYKYAKTNNLSSLPLEEIKKLYLYDKQIPKMKQMLDYCNHKEKLLKLKEEGVLSDDEYIQVESFSEHNILKIKKMLEYYLIKQELLNCVSKNLILNNEITLFY